MEQVLGRRLTAEYYVDDHRKGWEGKIEPTFVGKSILPKIMVAPTSQLGRSVVAMFAFIIIESS